MVSVELDEKRMNALLTKLYVLGKTPSESPDIKAGIRNASRYLNKRALDEMHAALLGPSKNLIYSPSYKLRKNNGGSLVGFSIPKGSTAHWIDRGTNDRYTRKGAYRGRIRPTYFWTTVRENDTATAMDMIADSIADAIAKIR